MKIQNSFLLEILFDKQQIASEELKTKIEVLLENKLTNNTIFFVNSLSDKTVILVLQGTLESIDDCHNIINKFIIDSQLSCIRVTDDAGDSIREKIYPILSEIEQRFRKFINQAILDVEDLDFEWWETVADFKLQEKAGTIRSKSQKCGVPLHPLECIFFEDLLEIIDSKVSKRSEKDPLCAKDFIDLLSRFETLEQVQKELEKDITKISYWDRIFSRYFQDRKQWNSLKNSLKFVIQERNKVMHHRPIRLGSINALKTKRQEIVCILNKAKTKLNQEERIETQQDIQNLQEIVNSFEFCSSNVLFTSFSYTKDFIDQLDLLSQDEQRIILKRLYFLDHLNASNLVYSCNDFIKPLGMSKNNIYIFKLNNRIRIICQFNKRNNNFDFPYITLVGIIKHTSTLSGSDYSQLLARIEENLE